jgi:glycosyltransferase involved in cell wall biosynthesis
MIRRKVLIVCMLDSIHAVRWLSQFTDQDIDFMLFPSKKFKKIHPRFVDLIAKRSTATFSVAHPFKILKILGYIDFAIFIQFSKLLGINFRAKYLKEVLKNEKFDYVHALEIQGAGYLCDAAIDRKNFRLIVTNWGNDIFYFQHLPEHLTRIKSILAKADLYSAECRRDYKLALELGFKGVQLPCIPNVGGLVHSEDLMIGIPPSERKNIVVKTYGGIFGRGDLAIKAVAEILSENKEITAYFYSVTDDLIDKVKELVSSFESRVQFSTTKNPISHSEISEIFERSRVYIGCAVSDGVSISFLEALAKGVYPIQTNTSCAGEWIEKGAIGSIVNLDEKEINHALRTAIEDDSLVSEAAIANLNVLKKYAGKSFVKEIALSFYDLKN